MDAIERDVMRTLVTDVVETMQEHAVPTEAQAAAFQLLQSFTPQARLTSAQVWAAVERQLVEARAATDVLVSCARAAQLTAMTRQGIAWHVKNGNLPAVKLRVAGRSRLGIPFTSLCDYFEIAPQRRAELTADLPRDAAGNLDTVFWDWEDLPPYQFDQADAAVIKRKPWPRKRPTAAAS